MKHSKPALARATRQAIDSYPGGLCFSTPGGCPILVNARMNDLIHTLTGRTLMECNATWEEMKRGDTQCQLLQHIDWFQTPESDNGCENLFFQFPDGEIWNFQRIALEEADAIQITAINVTELYRMSAELHLNNQHLIAMHNRQRALLNNIVQINRSRELLAAKMRIHDELGECLLRTRKAQADGTLAREHTQISRMWLDTLHNYRNFPAASSADAAEAELMGVAQMIGCQIDFQGPHPAEHKALHLLLAAVREALMNAVCHAKADRLTVKISEYPDAYHVRISDNGGQPVRELREGVGLTGLRRRLEQDGAAMKTECSSQGVALILELPKERDRK